MMRGDGRDTIARDNTEAAHVSDRLGDEIAVTDICSEAGVINRSISTYVIVFLGGRGSVAAKSQGICTGISSTFLRLCFASVTFCLRSASDI